LVTIIPRPLFAIRTVSFSSIINRKIELSVAILIVASLVIILIDYFVPLSETQRLVVYFIDFIVVILLSVDYYVRLKASKEGFKFIFKHWYEIPAMLPLLLYAVLDTPTIVGAAIRSLRLIALFRLFRLYRLLSYFESAQFIFLTLFSTVTVVLGSIGMYLSESENPNANIINLGDALWWAVGTVTIIAYGDVYPVTIEGKIIATFLMFAGIGILGTFISTLGAKLISTRLEKAHSGLVGEAKTIIKEKIDIIEKLDQKDFDTLIAMIRTLRQEQDK
jgi:voltage-gated potassium channel